MQSTYIITVEDVDADKNDLNESYNYNQNQHYNINTADNKVTYIVPKKAKPNLIPTNKLGN